MSREPETFQRDPARERAQFARDALEQGRFPGAVRAVDVPSAIPARNVR